MIYYLLGNRFSSNRVVLCVFGAKVELLLIVVYQIPHAVVYQIPRYAVYRIPRYAVYGIPHYELKTFITFKP